MNSEFKTPSRAMAALITVVLLLLFAVSYIAPLLNVSWLKADAEFDEALKQTLLTLLVLAIGYYLGSSRGSVDSGDALRKQLDKVTDAKMPPPATLPLAPVKIDDSTPIRVDDGSKP